MNRRNAIKLGAGLTAAAATAIYGGYELLPPSPSRNLESVDVLARRLYASLDEDQRTDACVEYDHPLRQYHNRGVWGGGRRIMLGFRRDQRRILTDLLYAGLSVEGRERIPEEFFTTWTGVHSMNVLICGDPTSPPYQIILTGAHLNLRLGGASREGAAFGGPQIYGDQRGDGRVGLPGNRYRDQFLLGQRLYQSLDMGRRKMALLDEAPVQTQIELQGPRGAFPGIPVSELQPDSRVLTRTLVERILAAYAPNDAAYAFECLEANGGLDALWLSYYLNGEGGHIFEAQVFRLEGPAAVFYYRGFPHLHAFVNVAMDGEAPLSVGEPLGRNPAWMDSRGVKALFETALRAQHAVDLAYYNQDSVAGRLRPGLVRSGDIYSLESWQEASVVAEILGSNLGAPLVEDLRQRGLSVDSSKTYTLATTSYAASDLQDQLGRMEGKRSGPLLRDLTVEYLRTHGFPAALSALAPRLPIG